MEKSTALNVIKYLKIATWVFIFITFFLFYLSFRAPTEAEQQNYTYYSFFGLGFGYLCNFAAKWVRRNQLTDDEK